ncbi:hypothetical protein CAPTEDRAFT_227573 [Capitella teleta]|uniref:Dachshund n=1 Tax=Capitella teleta TaxID=283909 RepID=R7TIT7_CAPTE|nr:hypothetical protein CAPTEDRAFT_227573 [Capitella teleta]|eukprot:ELT93382.1 hypothetical protein CAPTEDRAFT_227573 [Capitella teleta]
MALSRFLSQYAAHSRPGRPPKRSAIMSSPDTMEKLKKSRLEEQEYGGMAYPHSKLMEMKKTTLFNGYHAAGYPPQMSPLPFLPLGHPMMNFAMHHAASHLGGMRPSEHVMPPPPLPPPASNGLDLSNARHKERAEAESEKTSMPKPLNLEIQKMANGQHPMDKESDGRPSLPHPSMMRHPSMDDDRRRADLPHEDADDEEDDYDSYDDDDDAKVDDLNRHERALQQPPALSKVEEAPVPDDKMCASSSLETLLLNILGLLKVAAANARNWEHKMSGEKAELSMRAAHERELRDRYERQLQDERRIHEILEKKLKRERKVVKRLRHQIQITEHAQSRSEQQQSRDRMEVKMDDEEAPKLNRMRHEEINSDGEQSSCSSSSDAPCSPRVAGDHWRPGTQPAFPHPVVAPMTEVQNVHAHYDAADTGSYMMTSSQKLSSDSPGTHSVSSA